MSASTLAMVLVLAAATPVAVSAQDAPTGPCTLATRETYAHTVNDPVQLGGGPTLVVARQRAFLDSLRGPSGQVIQYRRLAQLQIRSDANTIVDGYEVTYEGLAKPILLYLDAYRWSEPMLPRGFMCWRSIPLGPPPPDPFVTQRLFQRIAVDYGRSRDLLPIPIDTDGSMTHGFALDHFRLIARASRAASLAGSPLDDGNLPPELAQTRTLVVAYPETCDDRSRTPRDIQITNSLKLPSRRMVDLLQTDRLRQMLPGATIPDGSIGAIFQIASPRPDDTLRITYDAPCGNDPAELILRVMYSPSRALQGNAAALPPGAAISPTPPPIVRIQVQLGPDGVARGPQFASGVEQLSNAAQIAIEQWRWDPARVNGAPVLTTVVAIVTFVK